MELVFNYKGVINSEDGKLNAVNGDYWTVLEPGKYFGFSAKKNQKITFFNGCWFLGNEVKNLEDKQEEIPVKLLKKLNSIRHEIGYLQMDGQGKNGSAITAAKIFDTVNGLMHKHKVELFLKFRNAEEAGKSSGGNRIERQYWDVIWIDLDTGEKLEYTKPIKFVDDGTSLSQGAVEVMLTKQVHRIQFGIATNEDDPELFQKKYMTANELEELELENHLEDFSNLLKEYNLEEKYVLEKIPTFVPDLYTFRELDSNPKTKHELTQKLKKLSLDLKAENNSKQTEVKKDLEVSVKKSTEPKQEESLFEKKDNAFDNSSLLD